MISYDGQCMNVYHCEYFEWQIIEFSGNYTIVKSSTQQTMKFKTRLIEYVNSIFSIMFL